MCRPDGKADERYTSGKMGDPCCHTSGDLGSILPITIRPSTKDLYRDLTDEITGDLMSQLYNKNKRTSYDVDGNGDFSM